MKSLKSIFKIAGTVMAVIGTVLVILGCLDEIREGFRKLAACRARREEMKDYATETMAGAAVLSRPFSCKDPRDEARPAGLIFLFSPRLP